MGRRYNNNCRTVYGATRWHGKAAQKYACASLLTFTRFAQEVCLDTLQHAADTVQTIKRMAELDEEAKGQQRDELLAELDAARQHVRRAERAVVLCDHNKARMADNFVMMERELKDVRRRAQQERAQNESVTKRLQAAKEQAEIETQEYRSAADQAQTELDRMKIRYAAHSSG
eukprot:COSAG01_NODE_345_length_18538_cov_64.139433_7_plen_173_part_00